ncbi:MAG: hypothetical protein IKF58_15135 [Bacillus sp. (in: Bacteria)]|nr:hypothetical protein [Bacillus sp. (in: firmicutes)]
MTEAQLQEQVAQYIRLQYPDVLFHSDFGSGIKMTKGQAIKQKRQNGGIRGWPDMFIAEPLGYVGERYPDSAAGQMETAGLFLELKKEGTRIKKKNGEWASEHIAEQALVLEKLEKRGYVARFAVGFNEAKQIIDEYIGCNSFDENFK